MAQDTPRSNIYPVRISLLVIAILIALICFGVVALLWLAISEQADQASSELSFITGAMIGLLAAGITGLVGLGASLAQTIPSGDGG